MRWYYFWVIHYNNNTTNQPDAQPNGSERHTKRKEGRCCISEERQLSFHFQLISVYAGEHCKLDLRSKLCVTVRVPWLNRQHRIDYEKTPRENNGEASFCSHEQREMVYWVRAVRSGRPWRHEAAATRPMRRARSWSRRSGERGEDAERSGPAWPPLTQGRGTRAQATGRRASGPAGCRRPPSPQPCTSRTSPWPTARRPTTSTATRPPATGTCSRRACGWARRTRKSCASLGSTSSLLDLSEYYLLWPNYIVSLPMIDLNDDVQQPRFSPWAGVP